MAALDFSMSMSGSPGGTNIITRVQLELGKKSYAGGFATGGSVPQGKRQVYSL